MSDLNPRPNVAALDDRELVDRLHDCQFDAMAEIYERHSTHAHLLATRIWGADQADQAVQDVFVQLWQTPQYYDPARGSLAVHLSMQVRLWTAGARVPDPDARRGGLPAGEERLRRSGLGQLHRRITDRAPFGGRIRRDGSGTSDRAI